MTIIDNHKVDKMGVVVNGPWPMSSFNIQNEISGNLDKSYTSTSSSSSGPWLKKIKIVKRIKRKIGLGSRGGESSPNNLPALVFHSVHGENIQLSLDATIARRIHSFSKAITFSNRCVKVNERVNIKLIEISQEWRGVLRFGFTNVDPGSVTSLPKFSIPDLTSKPGYWAKTFDESDTRFTGLNFKKDSILFYYVNQAGNVHFGINGDDKGVFFSGVDTRKPLWALIDVYGCTTALEFVDTRTRLNNSRKSLNESIGGGNSSSVGGSRPCSRNQKSDELELTILSSMSSMNLRSDEQYHTQHSGPYHHQHCRQRSLSCCQHYQQRSSSQNQHRSSHIIADDNSDEDLFQKPSNSSQKIDSSKQHHFEDDNNCGKGLDKKKLGQYPYSESQLEVVCRRASLSPASFNLFSNKSTGGCTTNTKNADADLNLTSTHQHSSESKNSISSPQLICKNKSGSGHNHPANNVAKSSCNLNVHNNAKNNNNNNNKGLYNMYVETSFSTTTPAPCKANQNVGSRQRHVSMYHYNNQNNQQQLQQQQHPTVVLTEGSSPAPTKRTCSTPLLPKIHPNRYSYHCGSSNMADDDYFEQQLLLAASSTPVSPACSSSSSSYVVVRRPTNQLEPIYTEVNNGGSSICSIAYNNNSSSSMYSYCTKTAASPVIQRNNSQTITPIYSTTTNFPNPSTPPLNPKVTAVSSAVQQQPPRSSSSSSTKKLHPQWSVGCVSCSERPVNSIFHACGHMCMCYQCAFEYWTNKEKATCPICSTIISDVVIRSNLTTTSSSTAHLK